MPYIKESNTTLSSQTLEDSFLYIHPGGDRTRPETWPSNIEVAGYVMNNSYFVAWANDVLLRDSTFHDMLRESLYIRGTHQTYRDLTIRIDPALFADSKHIDTIDTNGGATNGVYPPVQDILFDRVDMDVAKAGAMIQDMSGAFGNHARITFRDWVARFHSWGGHSTALRVAKGGGVDGLFIENPVFHLPADGQDHGIIRFDVDEDTGEHVKVTGHVKGARFFRGGVEIEDSDHTGYPSFDGGWIPTAMWDDQTVPTELFDFAVLPADTDVVEEIQEPVPGVEPYNVAQMAFEDDGRFYTMTMRREG